MNLTSKVLRLSPGKIGNFSLNAIKAGYFLSSSIFKLVSIEYSILPRV
jgi:hypothetical protein